MRRSAKASLIFVLLYSVPSDTIELDSEILKILLRDEMLAPEIDLKALAKKTESFSGSDLKREKSCYGSSVSRLISLS